MTTVVPTSTPELQRPSIPHPANGATVEVFADWGRAVEHLCDHVLTAPECDGWKVVVVGWEEVLNLDDGSCRLEYSKNARFPQGHSAQQLFDLYAEAIRLAALDAKNLGWHGSDGPVTVALGTSGVLVFSRRACGNWITPCATARPWLSRSVSHLTPPLMPRLIWLALLW